VSSLFQVFVSFFSFLSISIMEIPVCAVRVL
jgi:hypothetical protein